MIIPTVGRIVLYTLASYDVDAIRIQRGPDGRGNSVSPGDIYPAMVVRTWGDPSDSYMRVNLKVMLDGPDSYWATSRKVGVADEQGSYHWMDYQKGQAAKTEKLQAELDKTNV